MGEAGEQPIPFVFLARLRLAVSSYLKMDLSGAGEAQRGTATSANHHHYAAGHRKTRPVLSTVSQNNGVIRLVIE